MSKVKYIPYGKQYIDKKDIAAVVKTLKSDWITQGPRVGAFEKALARYCDVKYAVAVSSGTAALHLAYLASGLKEGDEAITTPNTFAATANMLLAVGARPVFCDIRLDTYNIDETKIEKLVTRRTRAIVPVHFSGQPCEMDIIRRIAKKHKLLVIEDGCHALGAKYKNKKIGGIGDMTVFSFHPVKAITTGEGGAIVTNNKKFHEKMLSLRSHGMHKDKTGKNVMTDLGYNFRMTDIHAALGTSQLKKLDSFIQKRRTIVGWYEKELGGTSDVILPREIPGGYSGWHVYVVRVKNRRLREKLAGYLRKNKIGANFHYPAVYAHPFYRAHGYRKTHLSNADTYAASCITLPIYPTLKRKELKYIVQRIQDGLRLR